MSGERCWLCNRKMQLFHERGHWRLWCSPCAASYTSAKGEDKDRFLSAYARFCAEKRGNGQLSMRFEEAAR